MRVIRRAENSDRVKVDEVCVSWLDAVIKGLRSLLIMNVSYAGGVAFEQMHSIPTSIFIHISHD